MVVGRNAHVHIGRGTEARGVAVDDGFTQRIGTRRQLDRVAGALHCRQGVVQRLEHREVGGGAGVAGIRRKVEDHRRDLALGPLGTPQVDQPAGACGEQVGTLDATVHVVRLGRRRPGRVAKGAAVGATGAGDVLGAATPAEHHRAGGAVEFRDRDHHRRLDRQQAAWRFAPLSERLKLDRRDRQIRHVERGEHLFGGFRVVVSRATDQRKAGQRDQRVDRRPAVSHEERVDRRAGIEPGREGRYYFHAARFHRGDHAVVMIGVAGEQVGAHQQQADGAALAAGRDQRQVGRVRRQPPRHHLRVVDADLRVVDRGGRLGQATECAARSVGVAVDQKVHHRRQVGLRTGEPILQGQKVGAHILCGAGHEAQDLRQPA